LGELYVDHLKEIKFNDQSFDYLVLDPQIKKMMKALICNVKISFKDIIGGKSSSCIFLLHGHPGVGKTLTCEAVSELLHKPLYSISVGELGTNVDQLKKRLNNILEIANSWEAVILIDEADIFMEARNKNDIERMEWFPFS
jgi:SpoVK/Ycf46/Vps4 family AAA+-type ATPase